MRINDADYEELLTLFNPDEIPPDPVEARQAIENFVDLVELLMRPLPLPPAGGYSFKPPSSPHPGPSSLAPSTTRSVSRVEGRD